MRNVFLLIIAFFATPFFSSAQEDCTIDFVWQLLEETFTVEAVDMPEGADLIFTVNGQTVENIEGAIELISIAVFMPTTICVEFTSDACPDPVVYCETIDITDILGGGDWGDGDSTGGDWGDWTGGGGDDGDDDDGDDNGDGSGSGSGSGEGGGVLGGGGGDCSLDFVFDIIDNFVSIEAIEFPEGAQLTFTVNGEVIEAVDDLISISVLIFLQPVTVCVEYTSDDCPEGIEFCETINLIDIINGGGDDCVDIAQIDPLAICPLVYMPVCGCNGVTYGNECEAFNYGGVTEWTDGACDGGGDNGCYDEYGVFYNVGSEIYFNECEFIYCEGPGNWSDVIVIPDCGQDCNDFLVASPQSTSNSCSWLFDISTNSEFAEVFWDFGDGSNEYSGYVADHTFSQDGYYVVTATYWSAACGLVELSITIFAAGCENEPLGCYDDNGTFYYIGSEQFLNTCEYIYCEGPGNWSAVQTLPGCEGECDDFIAASPYDFSPCNWVFEVISNGEISDLVWEFGDGIVQYGDSLTFHDYSMDGFYPVTVTYWSADCGIMTLTTEIEVYGCGNDEQGCYDDNGTFYYVGSEQFLNECEYIYCEGPGNWSSVQTIPDCGEVDCTLGFEWFPNPSGSIFAAAYDYPEGVNLIWVINGEVIEDGVNVFDFNPYDYNGPIVLCVFYESEACGGVEFCDIIDNVWGDLGCYEDNEYYPIGYQLFLNDCEYIFCEWTDTWSEVMEIPDCGEDDCGLELWFDVVDGVAMFEAYDYPENAVLYWMLNGMTIAQGVHYLELDDVNLEQFEICVGYETPDCPQGVFECVWVELDSYNYEDDCTIEFDGEVSDGYGGFEAWDYPEGVNLHWYVNGEFYAEGIYMIELADLPPNQYIEVCVGYMTEYCGEVILCEAYYNDDGGNIECTIELDSWTQGGFAGFEAYDYPAGEILHWYVNGEFYADGVNYIELFDIGYNVWLEVCVGYTNEECGDVFICDTLDTSGGMSCPDEIFAIPPKWSFCQWAFEVEIPNPNSYVWWNFGDGTEAEGESWIVHDYEESGVYTVSAFYVSPSCPDGVELFITIEVWGCNDEPDCINEDQIEENFPCTEEYAPVCGCDDVTYPNHCYAYFYHGITSWVEGECTIAVNDFETSANWKVYPVPTADGITLKDLPEGVWTCKMYDSRGRNVMTQDVLNGERLGLETLEEGWYTIQIVGIAGSAKRVIVQR